MYPFLCVGVADDCKTRGKYTFCTARLLHYKTRGKQAEPPNSTIFCEEKGIVNFLLFLNSVGIEKHYKTRMNHTFCVFADFHAFVTPAEKKVVLHRWTLLLEKMCVIWIACLTKMCEQWPKMLQK